MTEGHPEAPALLVIEPGTAREQSIPIHDRLMIGRQRGDAADAIGGVVIEDESVSRLHAEIRLYEHQDEAWVIDMSTNGTLVNGRRIERSVPVQLKPGDRLRIGPTELEFRSTRFVSVSGQDRSATVKSVITGQMVMAVGDVILFSTISEYTDERVLLEGIDALYSELRRSLARHHGVLSNYVGDAFFASWELASHPDAAEQAVSFALEANERIRAIGSALPLRDPSGGPIRMGWGIALGPAAMTSVTGRLMTVLGDTTNVAFRLSGMAGRSGWSDLIVTDAVHAATSGTFGFTDRYEVEVKGRVDKVAVYGAGHLNHSR